MSIHRETASLNGGRKLFTFLNQALFTGSTPMGPKKLAQKLAHTIAGADEHTKQHSWADTHDSVYITKNRPFSLC